MGTAEMEAIAELIDRALRAPADAAGIEAGRRRVRELCAAFPLYPERMRGLDAAGRA
jgi:glycine/serine hydroxymethyltransferase